MLFIRKQEIKNLIICFFICFSIFYSCANAQTLNCDECDQYRTQLYLIRDKNSPTYIKTKQKFDKFIAKNKIDYTDSARFLDAKRLLDSKKYQAASYELLELIDSMYETTNAYEMLGDISYKTLSPVKQTANYYKLAIKADDTNMSATYKLAKLYLKGNKNILGYEYLNIVVDNTNDINTLIQIEEMVKNNIAPQSRLEANNFCEVLGKVLYKLGKREESFKAFYNAIKLNKNDIYLKYYFADLLFNNNHSKDAAFFYDDILKEVSDNQIRSSKAKALAMSGNIDAAYSEYEKILNKNPDSIQAQYGIYYIYKDILDCSEILKLVYSKNNITIDDINNFINLVNKVGDSNALSKFQNYAIQYENEEKLRNFELNEKARIQKEYESNLKQLKTQRQNQLEEVKKQQTKYNKSQNAKKQIQTKNKNQNTKTIQAIPKKSSFEKEDVISKEQQLSQEKKQIEKEIAQEKLNQEKKQADLRKLELQKQEKEALKKAELEKKYLEYENKKIKIEKDRAYKKNPTKYNELDKLAQGYLKINPKNVDTFIAISNTYKQMDVPTLALRYLKSAIKLDPTNSELYYDTALLYINLDSFETARFYLDRAINLDKTNEKAVKLMTFVTQKLITNIINNAYAKFNDKKYIEASDILTDGIKKFPNSGQLYYYRALAYDGIDRNGAAIMDLQNATLLDPSLYMAFYQLGKSYEKIKDEKNALIAYERFLSIEPDDAALVKEIQNKVIYLGKKYY